MDTQYVTQRIQDFNNKESTGLRENGGGSFARNATGWDGRINKVTAWIIAIMWFLASCWYQHSAGWDVNMWRY